MQVLARRRGYTLVEFLVVLTIVTIVAAILFPQFSRPRPGSAQRASCQSSLKQMGLGFTQYAQDNDERFSPVATGPAQFYGWADALQPYIKSVQVYRCPTVTRAAQKESHFLSLGYWVKSEPKEPTPHERGYTDYWMNTRFSHIALKNIVSPAQSILSGDGNDGTDSTNARYTLRALPKAWLKDETSPAHRHLGTMNILFADGHVKAVQAKRIVDGAPHGSLYAYTFDPSQGS